MANDPLASIIVNNYNYAHFLREAIDSSLEQTYKNVEVIVVDDGSTDRSQEVIAGYGNRVAPLFKQNGGQNSALNAGFSLSRGEVIIFLDSDDVLLPTTVEKAVQSFNDSNVANVHWPLWLIDENSLRSGQVWPPGSLTDGYFRDAIIREGPHAANVSSPTSGNAWSRSFLRDVAPIPEAEFWNHGDTYLNTLAPLFGTVKSIREPQGCYRVHGT